MEWQDEGVLLSARPHGETSVIAEVFTCGHGRHAGVVRGGASRRMAAHLQPGTQLAVTWRARLDDHVGSFTVEPLRQRAGLLADRTRLAALTSVCTLLRLALPERDAHATLWLATVGFLDALEAADPNWPMGYLRWELGLLDDIGFGLDLARCAVTGATDDLAYVSPRTGRAVSRAAAGDWADRLLALPPCLSGQGQDDDPGIVQGLAVTGHFLARELSRPGTLASEPEARQRLITLMARQA